MHKIIKKLIALALLPNTDINKAFQLIKTECETKFSGNRKMKQSLEYYEKEWINKIIPEGFSVYRLDSRTNNFLKSYHRKLNSAIKKFKYKLIK